MDNQEIQEVSDNIIAISDVLVVKLAEEMKNRFKGSYSASGLVTLILRVMLVDILGRFPQKEQNEIIKEVFDHLAEVGKVRE